MNTIGQLGFFKDPALQRELGNIYALLAQRVQPENLDLARVAAALGQVLPFGQLRALEDLLTGAVQPKHVAMKLYGSKDDFVLYAAQDDSVAVRISPAVGFYSDSSAVETVQVQNLGDGRCLKLIGGNQTVELLKLEMGAGSARIIDTSVTGCYLSNGGVWQDSCTRARKIFLPLLCPDPVGYLQKLPIRRYRYKGTQEEHYGPTAEEFRDVYRIGEGDGLGAMDLAAVTALAVKCLTKQLNTANRRIARLERELKRCSSARTAHRSRGGRSSR